jgi:protein SCO1/2
MRPLAIIMACLCAFGATATLSSRPAGANFTAHQLAAISASPAPGAALPLDLSFRDEAGRRETLAQAIGGMTAVVIFADYTCHTLCGPIVEFAAAGLSQTGLRPGADYRLLVIGINPHDGADSARAMRANHIDPASSINRSAVFLSGAEPDIQVAATAVGLRYAYDAAHDQYAHPAAVYIVDSAGRVRRVLSALGLDGSDLRLAIVDAGRGAVGNVADRIRLLCYGYDPAKGIYTERITTWLAYAAAATLIAMAGGIFFMVARVGRRMPS